MAPTLDAIFASIEGSHRYLTALGVALQEARTDVDAMATAAAGRGAPRRERAIRLAAQKLERLAVHVGTSRRLLNDLRTLRRLLFDERRATEGPARDVGDARLADAGSP